MSEFRVWAGVRDGQPVIEASGDILKEVWESDLQPVAKCVCGHERFRHMNGGTCIAAYVNEKGKATASVCPCLTYKEKAG